MVVFSEQTILEILEYLEKSIKNLSKDTFENLELEGGFQGRMNFLGSQFDIRLENLLVAKGSSTHHLESGMKNKIIQRKQSILQDIGNQYKN
jgi:hypothetical protein